MSFGMEHGLLAGLGALAAAVPIVIHLIMRQKPRLVAFPAIRLLQKRRKHVVRTLQLRHLIVLALRVLALFLLGLALARPKLQVSGLASIDRAAPTAVALIFDTSPSMELRHQGKTRLEEAKELAKTLLGDFSDGAEFTVIDAGTGVPGAVSPYAVAVERIDRLTTQHTQRPLSVALENAFKSLAVTTLPRCEVYVFTDFAAHAWSFGDSGALKNAYKQIGPPTNVYVMNVGVEKPQNAYLTNLKNPQPTVAEGGTVRVQTSATNFGPAQDGVVEAMLDGVVVAQRPIKLAEGALEELSFDLPVRGLGVHQGSVRLKIADSLPFDEERFFTVEARTPIPTLVVAPSRIEAYNWINALEPEALRGKIRPQFAIDTEYDLKALAERDLAPFAAVCVLDTGAIPDAVWEKFKAFAEAGGGLFFALGPHVDAAGYNSPAAQAVLPAKLVKENALTKATTISLERSTHPIVAPFVALQKNDFGQGYVLRYWKATANQGSQTVLKYADESPALLERGLGAANGKCLVLTTPVHYRPRAYWSELPLRWSYLLLAETVVRHLAGVAEVQFDYTVGMTPIMDLPRTNRPTQVSVVDPKKEVVRVPIEDAKLLRLRMPTAKWIGHYHADSTGGPSKFAAGYSANAPDSESVLDAADVAKVELLLEKDKLKVARDLKTLERSVTSDRVGADLFPWVMLLLLVAVSVESWLANRFYKPIPQDETEPQAA